MKHIPERVVAAVRNVMASFSEPDSCWNWPRSCTSHGYGQIGGQEDGVRFAAKAHRVAFIAANGAIAEGAEIMHGCDNRRCINPRHLAEGSHLENMRDMASKGRSPRSVNPGSYPSGDQHYMRRSPKLRKYGAANGMNTMPHKRPRGESHGQSRLTQEQVIEILSSPVSSRKIAPKYGVHPTLITMIRRREIWQDLPKLSC